MSIYKPTPRPILNGIIDDSVLSLPTERRTFAQHTPFCYLWTERGDEDTVYNLSGAALINTLGEGTFDIRKEFFNEQTILVEKVLGKGNLPFIKVLKAPDAKAAVLGLGLEVVKDNVPVYVRNADGSVQTDNTGKPVQKENAGTPVTTVGHRIKWVKIPNAKFEDSSGNPLELSTVAPYAGTMVSAAGLGTSMVYPIFAARAYKGSYGNNQGVRLMSTVKGQPDELPSRIYEQNQAHVYRFAMSERLESGSSQLTPSIGTDRFVNFAFKKGVYDSVTTLDYKPETVYTSYNKAGSALEDPVVGGLREIKLFEDNVKAVGDILMVEENAYADQPAGFVPYVTGEQINIMDAKDIEGHPYYTVWVDQGTAASGGNPALPKSLKMGPYTTHYAQGGSDGTINNATYNELVRKEIDTNWENPNYPLMDIGKYPISDMYDTGFDLDTKKTLAKVLSYRPDMFVTWVTHVEGNSPESVAEENAMAATLTAHLSLFPESVQYGTGFCRGSILGSTMRLYNYKDDRVVSHAVRHAEQMAQWAGSGTGKLNSSLPYDYHPGSVLTDVYDVSNTYRPTVIADKSWDAGLCYPINIDINTQQVAAYQTAYSESRSVLNSKVVVQICCNIQKVLHRLWVEVTGRSDLDNAQLEEFLNRRFTELTDGIYAGRVTLTPKAVVTQDDDRRGYSFQMDIYVTANAMKTVGIFRIHAQRNITTEETN